MDLNESINMMNLEEIPKPEPIFRSSTLNKIIESIINKIEKTAEKISEEKTQESVFTYFKNLQTLENLNEIKNEDHSEENFTPSFMQEPLRLNHFSVKTDAKNNLPEFAQDFDSAESWAAECVFIFNLLGYTENDQKVMISAMMAKLGKELAQACQQNMAHLQVSVKDLKVDHFVAVLSDLTKKNSYEIDKSLDDLKVDYSNQASYRSSYWRIKSLLKRQLGVTTTTALNDKEIDKLVAREFKKKLPASITQNLAFRLNEKNDISLADLAYHISSLSEVGLNNFKTFGNSHSSGRGGYHRGARNNRGQNFGRGNFRGRSYNNFQPSFNNFGGNSRGQTRGHFRGQSRGNFRVSGFRGFNQSGSSNPKVCYFCQKPGHIEKFCRLKNNSQNGGRGQYRNYNH